MENSTVVNNKRTEDEIAEYLKELRQDNNLTQDELAKKMNYSSPNTISSIENGKKKIDVTLLNQYCDVFKISPLDIYLKNYKQGTVYVEKEYKTVNKKMVTCITLICFIMMLLQLNFI